MTKRHPDVMKSEHQLYIISVGHRVNQQEQI